MMSTTPTAPRLRGITFLLSLTLLISIAALAVGGFAGYQWWQLRQQHDTWHEIQQQQNQLQHTFKQHILQAAQQRQQLKASLDQQLTVLQQQQHRFAQQQIPETTANRLGLTAVHTSISMAQTLLAARQKPALVAQVMNQALDTLPVMNGKTETLRRLLAQVKAQALAMPSSQQQQALTTLDAISPQLRQLTFVQPQPVSKPTHETPIQWHHPKHAAQQLWQRLKSVVVVQSNTPIGQQLLTDAARVNATATLLLKVDEVRWYALTGNPRYNDAVQTLVTDIHTLTQATSAQQTVLTQLKQLQSKTVVLPQKQRAAMQQTLTQATQLADQLLSS